jgi:two-component system, OmpR family, KDP operon response regulator KdpE
MPDRARSVLVADDDSGLRKMLRSALERDGYLVYEARSAAEVFRTLDERQPDVVLLDIHLGPDDGIALGIGLRKEKRFSELKVVFMTGTFDDTELVELRRLWKVPILTKPFDLVALAEAMR